AGDRRAYRGVREVEPRELDLSAMRLVLELRALERFLADQVALLHLGVSIEVLLEPLQRCLVAGELEAVAILVDACEQCARGDRVAFFSGDLDDRAAELRND